MVLIILNENDFVFYVFKKNGEGNFSYEEVKYEISVIDGGVWKYNVVFLVGIYKFIVFYNLDEKN